MTSTRFQVGLANINGPLGSQRKDNTAVLNATENKLPLDSGFFMACHWIRLLARVALTETAYGFGEPFKYGFS